FITYPSVTEIFNLSLHDALPISAGEINILGRKDHQIKLRGYRIELGEIEHALTQFKSIKDALVTVREDNPGNQKLVAYLILPGRSEEHSLNSSHVKISYAVFCLK